MKKRFCCDLHTHSSCSDGELSPRGLVELAARYGLGAVSITDHDTIKGQEEALKAGSEMGIDVVTGIEFSARDGRDTNVHILGYYIDIYDPVIKTKLKWLRDKRLLRAEEILRKLSSECGITLSLDDLHAAEADSMGRPHIAVALLEKGIVSSFQEAFERFLGYGSKAYVPKQVFSSDEVIELILNSGGVPVWAHPAYEIRKTKLLNEFIEKGIAGLEVWHPNHNAALENQILTIAKEMKLIPTGGSDFHSKIAMKVDVGGKGAPYESVKLLKTAAARGHFS
ncbi:MAG TPA: PHP domain-containing protein [Candidatus Krumholzibacteriaceae bacterium]|nr:PHP domain-containing protein [Candidatus Krumholzibacteriaceae bacterium]